MKKTLAVLMAALLACACFATVGSAAGMTVAFIEGYDSNVVLFNVTGSFDALTDGVTTPGELDYLKMTDEHKKQIVAFQNTNCILNESAGLNPIPASRLGLVIDLGEVKTLESLSVWFYKCYSVMIGLGVENTLSISASTDGKTFTPVTDYTFTAEPAPSEDGTPNRANPIIAVKEEKIAFDSNVTARYFELKMDFEASDPTWLVADEDPSQGTKPVWEFIGMTEIVANEAPASTDESKDESVAESSKTPVTGDTGLAAFAVIAVVALAGALLLRRKRA